MANKPKPPKPATWAVSRIKGTPAAVIGHVESPDAETAIKESNPPVQHHRSRATEATRSAAGQVRTVRDHLTFGDIEGKLDMLIVECTRCPRQGRYSVAKLIAEHGRHGNMMKVERRARRRLPEARRDRAARAMRSGVLGFAQGAVKGADKRCRNKQPFRPI
jgi:hypothetical protein